MPLHFTKRSLLFYSLIPFLVLGKDAYAQATFKAGFKTYNTGYIVHEYNYKYYQADDVTLQIIDSSITYISTDSAVTMVEEFRRKDPSVYTTINYLNPQKQVVKTETYKNNNLQEIDEWTYDNKSRKTQHLKTNKQNGNKYRKQYKYESGSSKGETVVTESSYFNNKIEFYTKYYRDKRNVLYKEVRLNDNNKDIVHVETYNYGENGKVKERTVFFPEFKVTKKFNEPAGQIPAACFSIMPVGTKEKTNLDNRIGYIKRVITRNKKVLADSACKEYEFTFTNNTNCIITIATTKDGNGKALRYRLKEKV